MNSLAKESGKSRQRLKDVNAALLSARKPACDPKPNAFDYLNYGKPDGASGTDLTAIHNSGCHRPAYQAQVTFRTAPRSSKKKNIPTHIMPRMKEYTHICTFQTHVRFYRVSKYTNACTHTHITDIQIYRWVTN